MFTTPSYHLSRIMPFGKSLVQNKLFQLILYTVAITYGGLAWMHYIHDLSGIHREVALSPLMHWLRDATLTLPIVLNALWLVRRIWDQNESRIPEHLRLGAQIAVLALTASLAFAIGAPAQDFLLQVDQTHALESVQAHTNPSGDFLRSLADGLMALPINLAIAAILSLLFNTSLDQSTQTLLNQQKKLDTWLEKPVYRFNPFAFGKKISNFLNQFRNMRFFVSALAVLAILLAPLQSALPGWFGVAARPVNAGPACRQIYADVVALDQSIVYNRLGVMDPNGMIFALRQDVVDSDTGLSEADGGILTPGAVQLRSDKRPRPLTLRMNVGDCLTINFQNLLGPRKPGQPATRTVGISILGMQLRNSILDDGSNVGQNSAVMGAPTGGLVVPGGTTTYTVYGEHEGIYQLYSPSDTSSSQAIGVIAHGLFGAVNVEPRGAEWYRSQLSRDEMDMATPAEPFVDVNGNNQWDADVEGESFTDMNGNGNWDDNITTASGHPIIDYEAVYPAGHRFAGKPILRILDDSNKIVHADLTAVITGPNRGKFVGDQPDGGWYPPNPTYPNRNEPFREFTIIFHDEIAMEQAFDTFKDPAFEFTLAGVQDGKGINYGTGGVAAEVLANRFGVGPTWNCPECKLEEFFLTSWALGDPAMVVDVPANTTGAEAFTDINGNGQWDTAIAAETFTDTNNNGILDLATPAEAFVDANGNGRYDIAIAAEAFVDANGNNTYDGATAAESFTDTNDNGIWDAGLPAEAFVDANGNNQWDDAVAAEAFVDANSNNTYDAAVPAEAFEDLDSSGVYEVGEPFTDANSNNQWDDAIPAEAFTDANGNSQWDDATPAEAFTDANSNNQWDAASGGEPFVDTNGNSQWDAATAAEAFTDANGNSQWDAAIPAETFIDRNSNGQWDPGVPSEPYVDANANGQWDPATPAEPYTDANGNGQWDAAGVLVTGPKATKALYPEDPSNTYHSYINDHTKIRNIHIGIEYHIFHLHAHQWLMTPNDDNSTYLDSQAIGPGGAYTYEVAYSGSGNRNKTPGDAIFHCHFYPHFAQGMWALWRNHDVFEPGTKLDASGRPLPGSRALPDGEISAGTPIPGVVPLPGIAMAPMPGGNAQIINGQVDADGNGVADYEENFSVAPSGNPGFPFYIPGVAGHRPPTPPLDMTDPATGYVMDGGLPRHVITGGETHTNITPLDLTKFLETASAIFPAETGTPAEQVAMDFHAQLRHDTYLPDGTPATGANGYLTNGLPPVPGAPFAEPCRTDDGLFASSAPLRVYKAANIQLDMKLNKLGWHFPQARMIALWEDVGAFMSGSRAPEPFVMRANSGDCINYYHTNLIPAIYEQDAYQVRTPTDVIGQHIHLVKFDVTASDGSANGYNYEDGTLSPDEVRERIAAIRAMNNCGPAAGSPHDSNCPVAEANPFFGTGPDGTWLGARTTIQRWWADPVLNNAGQDRTLGNVYTHDHYGPSTHQQTGLYATLTIEPTKSLWRDPETGVCFGNTTLTGRSIPPQLNNGGCKPVNRADGGPTSWRADILTADNAGVSTRNYDKESFREYYIEFADFQHAYAAGKGATFRKQTIQIGGKSYSVDIPTIIPDPLYAVNPPGTIQNPTVSSVTPWLKVKPTMYSQLDRCPSDPNAPFSTNGCPEAISTADIGTFSMNYRNEPIGARVLDPVTMRQASGLAGDLSMVFSSTVVRKDPRMNVQPNFYPPLTADVRPGDPYTPLMRAYEADKVRIKVQVGATEEGHNGSLWGTKWLQEFASPNSGWRNSQMMGISEQFNWDTYTGVDPLMKGFRADYIFTPDNSSDGLWNGVWSILRSYSQYRTNPKLPLGTDLLPLPNNRIDLRMNKTQSVSNLAEFDPKTQYQCPVKAPKVQFNITAVLARDALPNGTLVYNSRTTNGGPLHDPTAILYVRSEDLDANGKLKPGIPVEPLILRARAGDCINVVLKNRLPAVMPDLIGYNFNPPILDSFTLKSAPSNGSATEFNFNDLLPSNRVGLRPQLVAYETTRGSGTAAGMNNNKTVAPGQIGQYWWYAGDLNYNTRSAKMTATPIEFGAINLISSDLIKHSNKGAIGGLIIEPEWSAWKENPNSRASAIVYKDTNKNGKVDLGEPKLFRDFVLLFQDDINMRFGNGTLNDMGPVPNSGEADDAEDTGQRGLNYRTEPLWFRMGVDPRLSGEEMRDYDFTQVLSNNMVGGDPQTPIFVAQAGEAIRLRVLQPAGHARNHVFALHGHIWPRYPYTSACTSTPCLGSTMIGNNPLTYWVGSQDGHGPTDHWDFIPEHGAGGAFGIPGDYLFRDMVPISFYNGIWGLLRVVP